MGAQKAFCHPAVPPPVMRRAPAINGVLAARIENVIRTKGLPDGLPIPPARLIESVSGSADLLWFYESGRMGALSIARILRRNALRMSMFKAILDFVCGCRRTLRHWNSLPGNRLYGADYNAEAIDWCRAHLPFVRCETNRLRPPLPFHGRAFDFVYALSVFTHFPEDLAREWLQELRRRVRLGGFVLLTTHGEEWRRRFLKQRRDVSLTDVDLKRLGTGRIVTKNETQAGTNSCMSFHSLDYVRSR